MEDAPTPMRVGGRICAGFPVHWIANLLWWSVFFTCFVLLGADSWERHTDDDDEDEASDIVRDS